MWAETMFQSIDGPDRNTQARRVMWRQNPTAHNAPRFASLEHAPKCRNLYLHSTTRPQCREGRQPQRTFRAANGWYPSWERSAWREERNQWHERFLGLSASKPMSPLSATLC